ncbi:hypothetical protein BFL28_09040 [Sphingomonas turrisvirgatae]|uniref:Uncharacterized protein n=2 Tax=Sphingomonas turrisvirgatae TaxID=1888892 RepID=A0A1E3M0W3_9SPHN|nr:hypothetical protein BFL28_09040 [Sphingomonas turrisvirgatae]
MIIDQPAFEAACVRVVAGWDMQGVSPARIGWLEREVYALIGSVYDNDDGDFLDQREARLDSRGAPARTNPFMRGLRVIFADRPKMLSSALRERTALRLMHAYRHFTPLSALPAFLRHAGQRPNLAVIEPGFEDWIAMHLAWSAVVTEHRGDYPAAVQRLEEEWWDKPSPFKHGAPRWPGDALDASPGQP